MAASVGRRLRDGCLSLGGIGAVVAGVVTIDETSRRYFFDALHGQLPPNLLGPTVQHLTRQIAEIAPIGNTGLLTFGASALVLLVLMFRS